MAGAIITILMEKSYFGNFLFSSVFELSNIVCFLVLFIPVPVAGHM